MTVVVLITVRMVDSAVVVVLVLEESEWDMPLSLVVGMRWGKVLGEAGDCVIGEFNERNTELATDVEEVHLVVSTVEFEFSTTK